jgi:osmotically inducible protein OsmC
MKRTANAVWEGGLKDGQGSLTTQSAVLKQTPYSFRSRFGDGTETNPEELIAAAHSGCFSMALSMVLGEAGITAEKIETKATVTLDQVPGGFGVTGIHLEVKVASPGSDRAVLEKCAQGAKENCPISKLMKAPITMETAFEV